MKIKKFTLKKEPRYNPFDNERYMIKRGKEEVVGFIAPVSPRTSKPLKIRLSIRKKEEDVTKTDPCDFKWIQLKKKFDTYEEAKALVSGEEFFSIINEKYDLYPHEDEYLKEAREKKEREKTRQQQLKEKYENPTENGNPNIENDSGERNI